MPLGQLSERDIHDAHTLQLNHIVATELTHAPNLAVEPLREDDAKRTWPLLLDLTLFGDCPKDGNAPRHALQKLGRYHLIDHHLVLLLVVIGGTQDLVDDISIVCEQDKPLGHLIESPDVEDAGGEVDKIDDVVALSWVGGRYDANGLVEGEVDDLHTVVANPSPVNGNRVGCPHFCPHLSDVAIYLDTTLFDIPVRLAARAEARITDELI